MLKDNLVGLIMPMQSCGTQALGDEFSYLENPRPVGAESSLTESASSPFQTEPRQNRFRERTNQGLEYESPNRAVDYLGIQGIRRLYGARSFVYGYHEQAEQPLKKGYSYPTA